jgi:hypothetical protein
MVASTFFLLPHHACVKKSQTRDCHHQHKARRADHPGRVAGVDFWLLRENR